MLLLPIFVFFTVFVTSLLFVVPALIFVPVIIVGLIILSLPFIIGISGIILVAFLILRSNSYLIKRRKASIAERSKQWQKVVSTDLRGLMDSEQQEQLQTAMKAIETRRNQEYEEVPVEIPRIIDISSPLQLPSPPNSSSSVMCEIIFENDEEVDLHENENGSISLQALA